MNDEENNFNFKDKEIEKITSEITKANKHQFGESFQDAITRGGGEVAAKISASAPSSVQANPVDVAPTVVAAPVPPEEPMAAITPLQTYERDIAEAIRSSNESVASINLAQQKKLQQKGGAARTEKIARKSLTLLISLVLIISAVGISGLVYYFILNRPAFVTPDAPSIITTDEKHNIDVTDLKAPAVAEKIRVEIEKATTLLDQSATQNFDGKIVLLNLTENITDVAGVSSTQQIPAVKFFEFFALSSPPTLGRALSNQWVFGFQKIATENGLSVAPFIFARVDSFDNAFEGMHRWEEKMSENLKPIFFFNENKNPNLPSDVSASSTSATTSASTIIFTNKFEDKIIQSKDVRVLKDTTGKIILLYSFLDQKNLIITTNERTFGEILNRFFASQIVR